MIKVLNQYFPRRWAVLVVGESLLILLALLTAVLMQEQVWPPAAPIWELVLKGALIALVCQICLHYGDLYAPEVPAAGVVVVGQLMQAIGLAALILALLYWVMPGVRLSTGSVMYSVLAIVVILMVWRRAIDAALRWAQRAYPEGERLLVLGTGERAAALVRELRMRPQLGLAMVGMVGAATAEVLVPGVPVLGGLNEVERVIAAQRPQRIALALEDGSQPLPAQPLLAAWAAGIRIEEAPTLFERVAGRVALETIAPSWLILSETFHKSRWLRIYRRLADMLLAGLALVLLSPLLALTALAVKLDSRGPVLYRQTRVGLHGATFEIWKFRSMRADAESLSGPVWAQERDPRITFVGAWLRKLRLDELPQLCNVLRGDMSIVGPRPERPQFVEQFRESIPYYDMRHSVRPGITGWAQVNRDYGASLEDAREKLEYDLFYIKNLSVWLDLFILFQTTKIVALGRGAR